MIFYSEWETLGGYYWVIQEQILKQLILFDFKANLERLYPQKDAYVQV